MSAALSASFEKMVDNKISSSHDSISKACDDKISQSHCAITSAYDHKIAQLEDEVNKLNARLDDQDTQSRSKSLVLFGVVEPTPHESSSETDLGSLRSAQQHDLLQSVLSLCCDWLHIALTEQDISDVRRLPRKTGIRPILVEFTSKRIRDKVYHARLLLKVSDGQQTPRMLA